MSTYSWRDVAWSRDFIGEWEEQYGNAAPPSEPVTFLGQAGAMEQLEPWVDRMRPMPHILLKGEPGLGKTQLARWIAYKRSEPFTELMSPIKPDQLPGRGIVLLDEAHLIKKPEWMYPIMEKGVPTIIAATTRPDKLDGPFRSRFFLTIHLDRYSQEDMVKIIADLAPDASSDIVEALAKASGGSPRQANRLVETAETLGEYDPKAVLAAARITADGLTEEHMRYLLALKTMVRPTGAGQIAVLMYSDEDGVKQLERFLLDLRFIELKNGGRVLTHRGASYLKRIMGG